MVSNRLGRKSIKKGEKAKSMRNNKKLENNYEKLILSPLLVFILFLLGFRDFFMLSPSSLRRRKMNLIVKVYLASALKLGDCFS